MNYLDLKEAESGHQRRIQECKNLSDEKLFEAAKDCGETYELKELILRYNKKKNECEELKMEVEAWRDQTGD